MVQVPSVLVSNGLYAPGETGFINIFSSNGILVQKKTISASNQIPIIFNGLPAGVYTLSAQVNSDTYTSKFVIQ